MLATETVKEIVEDAKALQHELLSAKHQLRDALDEMAVEVATKGVEFSQAQREQRAAWRAAMSEVNDAILDLNWVTLQRLNASEDVKMIRAKMMEINDELRDDIQRLKRLEHVAATAAQVVDTIAKVVEKTVALAAKLS